MASEKKEKPPKRTEMEGMIANANKVLANALDPKNEGVPRDLFENCAAIALLTTVETGFFVSISGGTGVILARDKSTGKWSPPSACGMGGMGFGFIFGAAAKDIMVLLMDDKAVQAFTGDNQIKLGGEIGLAVGPIGREVEGAVNASGEGVTSTLTYTYSKGAFVSAGLEGQVIKSRAKENEKFYGQPATAQEILTKGAVTPPEGKGIEDLHKKLDMLRKGETTEPEE
mmetsp:Transcript_5979/g.13108  ORF Transcript_5979/g.13108 Transcript_5979/m.13108 type:complete len:228 (-) Transcript_5979:363-1046(-)